MAQLRLLEPGVLKFGDLAVTVGAEPGVVDLVVQLEDGVHQHLRARRASGQVDVDGHDVVDTVLSERENEIVIGTNENAPAAYASCRLPIPRRSRTACILTSPAVPRTAIRKLTAFLRSVRAESTSGRPALSPGLSLPILRETSSV